MLPPYLSFIASVLIGPDTNIHTGHFQITILSSPFPNQEEEIDFEQESWKEKQLFLKQTDFREVLTRKLDDKEEQFLQ